MVAADDQCRKLTINPESFSTFDWSNVKYCDHPDIAC
jgi:hypothetical protein